MKAFIPAAGLGTRLHPITLNTPKALVEVAGVPMLERVILRLKSQGFDDIVINLHHFGDKIVDFVRSKESFGVKIRFSDESDRLLDTGGGILHAQSMLSETSEPFLIHNVDILSNADVSELMKQHISNGAAASLLVSDRKSSRRLIWDDELHLRGWHNLSTGEYRPSESQVGAGMKELAFSGIHVMSPEKIFDEMRHQQRDGVFSIIDFYLSAMRSIDIRGIKTDNLQLIDIGKPDTLLLGDTLLRNLD